MFEGWSEFYLLVGSAAAVLIGLLFVVIGLMQDRSRSSVIAGSRLYMGPIVLGLSFILVLSAAALFPGMTPPVFAAVIAIIALWGLIRGIMSTVGIARLNEVHWSDVWFYGVLPSLFYASLGGVALTFLSDWRLAEQTVAALITLGLLLAIRNEWDLITWIAPRSEGSDELH